MNRIFGSFAQTATAFLALTAGAKTPGATARPSFVDNAVQPLPRHLVQAVDATTTTATTAVAPPPPRHVAGHAIPNRCATQGAQPHAMGVAVAHYDEDLSWLGDRRQNATIYCKNVDHHAHNRQDFRDWVELPNIGLESHTYLYHIISHWDCLDDATLFTQGRADDSVDNYQGIEDLFQRTLSNPEGMILYRLPGIFNEWWGVGHFGKWKEELDTGLMRKSQRNPGEFWRWMFYGEPPPETIAWTWSATFAVRREAIKRRPRRFYQRLLHHFEAVNHTRPEEGHFMERFWLSVFKSDAGLNSHRLRTTLHHRPTGQEPKAFRAP